MSVLRKRQLLYIYTEVLLRLVTTFMLSCLYVSRSKMPLPRGFCTCCSFLVQICSSLSILKSLLKCHLSKAFPLTSPICNMVPPPTFFSFSPHSGFLPSMYYPLAWCMLICGFCPWNLGFMKAATLSFLFSVE